MKIVRAKRRRTIVKQVATVSELFVYFESIDKRAQFRIIRLSILHSHLLTFVFIVVPLWKNLTSVNPSNSVELRAN